MKKELAIILSVCTAVYGLTGCAESASAPAPAAGTSVPATSSAVTESETTTSAAVEETTADSETTVSETTVTEEEVSDEQEYIINSNRADTEDYKLTKVVVLSRHNIRAPLSSNGSVNEIATPHEWFNWTSNSSELSLRGGVLETEMGQYFRKWLEAEELIPENWMPEDGELRIYANSKQRTLATAHYFSSGFLPAADVTIEHHGEFGNMDDTFNPVIHFYSEAYAYAVAEQFEKYGGAEIAADISENVAMLCDLIDYKDSEGYKTGELTDLVLNDTELIIEPGKEPTVSGSLKTACTLSDAFVLQYYEEPDSKKAAFGNDMTQEMWQRTADITTKFNLVRHGLPLVAINLANPMIREIRGEFTNANRKFSFLCGHDCTVNSVLISMGVEDYELPYTLEKRTPIGVKLVFEKWEDKDGNEFASVELIYQSTDQLRNVTMLDLETPPAIYSLSFEGLEKNADGLYSYDDIIGRLDMAIADYDDLAVKYADALDDAA
ncbi:MAG: histidine-type phosphatase [Oscillospiraceae bacterium]|nr:histidine-type phosphatase [Oscillospiraceae bacterium]